MVQSLYAGRSHAACSTGVRYEAPRFSPAMSCKPCVNARQIFAKQDVLPRWAQQPSQTTFLLSLISATIFLSVSRELTDRNRIQTILLSLSIPVICAVGAAAGMQTLVEVMYFFHQSVALALALSFVLRARDAPIGDGVTSRGKG